MKQLYVKDSEVRIDGTVEVLSGLAIASSWEADANGVPVPEYSGTTEVWWNDQRTKRDDGGNMMVQGDDGETYSILECELRDNDEDRCDECGGPNPDGGDGYDGLCASCADRKENKGQS